jgi:hypothetical protein
LVWFNFFESLIVTVIEIEKEKMVCTRACRKSTYKKLKDSGAAAKLAMAVFWWCVFHGFLTPQAFGRQDLQYYCSLKLVASSP